MTKTISLLGSTGSIGRQTLQVARELGLSVAALTANRQVDLLDYIRSVSFERAGEKTLCRCVLAAGGDPLNPLYLTAALKQAGLIPQEADAHYLRTGILDKNCRIFQQ